MSLNPSGSPFSKLLNLTHAEVLLFYVGQTRRAMEKRQQGPSKPPDDALQHFFQSKKQTDLIATEMCLVCPGTDLLEKEDLEVMFKHCSFVSLWLDSALMAVGSYEEDLRDEVTSGEIGVLKALQKSFQVSSEFLMFTRNFQKTVTASLARLKLDAFEYSALKGFCIWKTGVFSATMSMVANEHYLALTNGLVGYYKSTKPWEEYVIANRVAEINLLLGPISGAYQDVQKLYSNLGIRDVLE